MHPIEISPVIEALTAQPTGVGMFLAGTGVVFMLLGHRIFRGLIGLSFGGVGFLLGSQLAPQNSYLPIVVGLVVGAGLGVLSFYFVRMAVAVLAGGWCGLIVAHFAALAGTTDAVIGTLGIFAFILAIAMAFIMYDEIIAFVTSLEGAFLCVASLVILFSHSPMLWAHLRNLLTSNGVFGPFLVLTGTVTGFYFQLADLRHKNSGTQM